MERKLTARVWKEGELYLAQPLEVDDSNKGCPSTGSGRMDIDGESGLCSEAKATHVGRSCEDVFGEFQGQLVFLEDPDAPTTDEWSDV